MFVGLPGPRSDTAVLRFPRGVSARTDRLADWSYADSLDSLEGVPVDAEARVAQSAPRRVIARLLYLAPGLGIALLVALAASWLADQYTAPLMLFALLLGMAVNFLSDDDRCRAGLDFAARAVLRAGVALLGARITLTQIHSLGTGALLLIVAAVISTIAAGWLLARLLKLPPDFGILTGGAVAICGASAALALSSVLPQSPTRERDTILAVVGVTTLSTLAMILYPLLAELVGLNPVETGVFLGGTIHDVAQVVGAGYASSDQAGDTATVVKLMRVAMLLPVTLAVALVFRSTAAAKQRRRPPLLPMFLVVFAVLVVIGSMVAVPPELIRFAGEASGWCLVIAIAALGVKTRLGDIAHVGWRPAVLVGAETVFVLLVVLTAILTGAIS